MKKNIGKFITSKRLIFLACMILVFNILGVGYGSWSRTIYVNNKMYTGKFDVMFLPVNNMESADIKYDIADDGKTLTITISNASADKVYMIPYIIRNNGTIQAFGKPADIKYDTFCGDISIDGLSEKIEHDEQIAGNIKISTKEIEKGKAYKSLCTIVYGHEAWEDKLVVDINVNAAPDKADGIENKNEVMKSSENKVSDIKDSCTGQQTVIKEDTAKAVLEPVNAQAIDDGSCSEPDAGGLNGSANNSDQQDH